MIELYALAADIGGIVCGTENYSEYHLGYFTLHGDAASDIEPIHGLLKTELKKVALYLGLPLGVVDQVPSAELWAGQTDEAELGFSYAVADAIIRTRADSRWMDSLEISHQDLTIVVNRIKATAFKRREKPVFNLPNRVDFSPE
jgi:NAD+ synthase